MKNKILYGIIAIILIAGIATFFIHGFNIGNVYGSYTKIGLYIETGVNKEEVRQIVNESFENSEYQMQDVEYFGEMVLITLPQVSDEQIDTFLAKINEKYSLEYTKEDLDIFNMPALTFYEVAKPYIWPVTISIVLGIAYMAIRYYSLGVIKVIGKTILSILIIQALAVSLYLIFNLPIDLSIVPTVLFGLGIALLYTANKNNQLLDIKKEESEEN